MLPKSTLDYITYLFHFPLYATDLLGKPGHLSCRISNILELLIVMYMRGFSGLRFHKLLVRSKVLIGVRFNLFLKSTISGGNRVCFL